MKSFAIILAASVAASACAPTQPVQYAKPKFAPTTAVFATDKTGAEFAAGQAYDTIVVRTLALDDSREIVGVRCVAEGEEFSASLTTPVDLMDPKPSRNGAELILRCKGEAGEEFERSIQSYGGSGEAGAEEESGKPSGLGILFAVLAESATDVATEALTGQRLSRSGGAASGRSRYTSSQTNLIDG